MKLIAREPTPEMLKAGVDWTRGMMNPISTQSARGIFAIMWDAAPSARVEVTDQAAIDVWTRVSSLLHSIAYATHGHAVIAAVQQVLGPSLGLVTREEMAREVEAAKAEERHRLCAAIKATDDAAADCDYMLDSDDCIRVIRGELGPENYKTQDKRLGGGE